MGTPKKIMLVLMVLIVLISVFLPGCKAKTQVKYITSPTGFAVAELDGGNIETKPVSVTIKDKDTASSQQKQTVTQNKTKDYNLSSFKTVVDPAGESENGNYVPEYASVDDVKPSLCGINEVILGYVGCWYDESKTSARVTLKDTGRGNVEQMWFYIVVADKTGYAKAPGFMIGYINDYTLPLLEWTKKFGKIQRILITPVIDKDKGIYACNNRQLLLLPEQDCIETKG